MAGGTEFCYASIKRLGWMCWWYYKTYPVMINGCFMFAERRARVSKESEVLAQELRTRTNGFLSQRSVLSLSDVKKLGRMDRDLGRLYRRSANNAEDTEAAALGHGRAALAFTHAGKLFSAGMMRRAEANAYKALMRKAQEAGDDSGMRRFAKEYLHSSELAKHFRPFNVFIKYPVLRYYHKVQYSM
jgi:hypothetical protein